MINNQSIKEILQDWSFWDEMPNVGLKRQIELPAKLHPDLAFIIQGVRRSGKSTLLAQLPSHYNLPLTHCYYCNFEDPRLLENLDYHLLTQIIKLARDTIPTDEPCYFFLDEIQNVKEWEKWLHMQLERPKNNYFIVTGSNSSLLSGKFATSLTGRHLTLELFPFSFSEYITLFPEKKIEDYLISGGFPRVMHFEHPQQLLQEYFNDIIYRDVLRSVRSRSPETLKQVAKMALESCGSELSYRKIAGTLNLTVDTVKSYLDACEDAYLLFSCNYFAFSEKKQLNRPKKYYPIDTGLRNAVTTITGRDLGKNFESMVFLQLRKKHKKVFYWQEIHKGEVDFVTMDGSIIQPYQVTWDQPKARHEKSLRYFYEAFPQAEEPIFITPDSIEIT